MKSEPAGCAQQPILAVRGLVPSSNEIPSCWDVRQPMKLSLRHTLIGTFFQPTNLAKNGSNRRPAEEPAVFVTQPSALGLR